jgi:hypothetical protein
MVATLDLKIGLRMASEIHSIIANRIHEEGHKLRQDKVDPWFFMTAGPPFQITNFYGKIISYQGIEFEGSPRHVFWGRYIEPFIEDIVERVVTETAQEAIDRHVAIEPALRDAEMYLKQLAQLTYRRMAEVDQRLSGKGNPSSVKPRPVEKEIAGMESLFKERISVELAAPRKARGLEGFFQSNQLLFWGGGIVVAVIFALLAL